MKKCLLLSLLVVGLGLVPAWAQPGISVSVGNNGWGNGVQWGITVGNGPNYYPANYPVPVAYPAPSYPVYQNYPVYNAYPVHNPYPVYTNANCGQVVVPGYSRPCAPVRPRRYRRCR